MGRWIGQFLGEVQMVNKYMKNFSMPLARKEMQIKIHWDFISPSQNGSHQENNQLQRPVSIHDQWECKLVQSLWKLVWRLITKLKTDLPMTLLYRSWEYSQRRVNQHTCVVIEYSTSLLYNIPPEECIIIYLFSYQWKLNLSHCLFLSIITLHLFLHFVF
jgi:hypothetical protein